MSGQRPTAAKGVAAAAAREAQATPPPPPPPRVIPMDHYARRALPQYCPPRRCSVHPKTDKPSCPECQAIRNPGMAVRSIQVRRVAPARGPVYWQAWWQGAVCGALALGVAAFLLALFLVAA